MNDESMTIEKYYAGVYQFISFSTCQHLKNVFLLNVLNIHTPYYYKAYFSVIKKHCTSNILLS